MSRSMARRLVFVLVMLLPLVLCSCSVGGAVRRGFDEGKAAAQEWWETTGKQQAKDAAKDIASGAVDAGKQALQVEIEKAKSKPENERTAMDWLLILLGGGSGVGAVWVLLQRFLLGHRGSAAASIASEVVKAIVSAAPPPKP